MSAFIVCGVDPGPIPGVVGLLVENGQITDVQLAQVSAGIVGLTVGGIVMRWLNGVEYGVPVLIAVERYVVGARSSRSSTPAAGRITRDMVGVIERCGEELGAVVVQRSASQVKAWATDDRLEAADIWIPKGMRHAKDSARHALHAAVHAGHLPDPLSKNYRKPQL